MLCMKLKAPPANWKEGLPIGNGRLAAMVWGGKKADILSLNHEWLWRGINRGRKVIPNVDKLPFVRDLLRKGEFAKATKFGNLYFGGEGLLRGKQNRVDPFVPAGDLCFTPDGIDRYDSRELNLDTGVSAVRRLAGKNTITGEFFAGCETSLLYASWQSPEPFSGMLSLGRKQEKRTACTVTAEQEQLTLTAAIKDGLRFKVTAAINTNGQVCIKKNAFRIENAAYIHCIINIVTSARDMEAETERYPVDFNGLPEIRRHHEAVFSSIMRRVSFSLEGDESFDKQQRPLDERLKHLRAGERNNGLTVLLYNFGRYLLVSSAISGELPPNLQGKWNNMLNPPWDSDYHFDINLEMCHWIAEPCQLAECAENLFRYVESYYESGAEAARALYGCRGIYLPSQSDAWGISTPESYGWAVWIGAAPWLARHFWDHYRYGGDINFLRDRAYPYFKKVAEFYEDYLQQDADGVYQILPSQSPENKFKGSGILPVALCVSSAMDVQLCYDALGYAAESARPLGETAEADKWANIREHLPPFKIGTDGRLLEWNEEKTELKGNQGHRHFSHLYGVYPSDLFTPNTEQYEAARKSFYFRMAHSGGHTGWSRAWCAVLTARFNDGQGVYSHITALLKDFVTATLLDLHPPGLFQIDGNLGIPAAVNEALISAFGKKITILRALPREWPNGSLEGIKTPGGHIVNVSWRDNKAVSVSVKIGFAKTAVLEIDGKEFTVSGDPGETIVVL